MSKPVIMRPEQWGTVLEHIKQREKPSVYLSREKMKETLGFTVRDHREYIKEPNYVKSPSTGEWHDLELVWFEGKTNVHTVRLDFYDDQKRTMFLLKYGNGQN